MSWLKTRRWTLEFSPNSTTRENEFRKIDVNDSRRMEHCLLSQHNVNIKMVKYTKKNSYSDIVVPINEDDESVKSEMKPGGDDFLDLNDTFSEDDNKNEINLESSFDECGGYAVSLNDRELWDLNQDKVAEIQKRHLDIINNNGTLEYNAPKEMNLPKDRYVDSHTSSKTTDNGNNDLRDRAYTWSTSSNGYKMTSVAEEEEIQFETDSSRLGIREARLSLDSQITNISKYRNLRKDSSRLYSLPELNEPEGFSANTKQRKSISWAEDLETVHEFEKIKGRKLSLSSLFKKM